MVPSLNKWGLYHKLDTKSRTRCRSGDARHPISADDSFTAFACLEALLRFGISIGVLSYP